MGNQFSASGNSGFCYLDKPHYAPGDAVTGMALVNVHTALDCKDIKLTVEAYEKTSWEQEESVTVTDGDDTRTDTRRTPCSGKREIWKVTVPLYSAPQRLNPGQYQFPFSFMLPHGLPGSMLFQDNNLYWGGMRFNYTKAAIKYKVKVECTSGGMGKPAIKGKSYLTVYQHPAKMPSEIRAEHTQEVRACCCAGQGAARMIAHIEKDSYGPGQTANIILQVQNDSDADFSSVELKLHRKLCLRADGVGEQRHEEEVAKAHFPGVPAHSSCMDQQARVLSLPLPATLQPSTDGRLISCQYQVIVELKAGMTTGNVRLKVPIQVYVPCPTHQAYSEPPSWWKPTVQGSAVAVALPSAPPMPPAMQQMYAPPQPTYAGPQ